MKLTTKAILWAWIILLTVIGSLVYSAYSKLNPDALISVLNTEVQRGYPGSTLNIGKIDYGFSVDFTLSLRNVTLVRGGSLLATADKLELKVPWWLILLNRGHASINISDLDVFISADLSDPSKSAIADKKKDAAAKVHFNIPQYLIEAHYTLRAKNISIKEIGGERRFFTLSKLLVREFQYGKNSAFELNIPISITHQNKNFSSELWLFGDVTPEPHSWDINYRGEFKTKEGVNGFEFDDLVIDGKSTLNPIDFDLISQIELLVEKNKIGTGVVSAKHDQFKIELNLTKFPIDFLTILGDEIRNPYWKKNEGTGEGSLIFTKSFSKGHSTSIIAKLTFPGSFALSDKTKIQGIWFLDFKNGIWENSFQSEKQDLKFSRRSVLDFSKGQITQYSQELGFTGCDFNQSLVAVESLESIMKSEVQPLHSTVVLFKQCLQNEQVVDATFRYGVFPSQKYFQAEVLSPNSSLNLKYSNKSFRNDFALALKNFSGISKYKFLGSFASVKAGTFNGNVEGNWQNSWQDGVWLVNLSATNVAGETGLFFNLDQQAWNLFSIDTKAVEKRSWNASVKDNTAKIQPFVLSSNDSAHLNGSLFFSDKSKSYLTLTYPANKKWKPVKKEIIENFWEKEAL